MEMLWYNVKKEYKTNSLVLGKDKRNNVHIGFLEQDSDGEYKIEGDEGVLYNVTHFIPLSELLSNIDEEK